MGEEGFDEGDVLVGGAGGGVDEQVVRGGPEGGGEELADHGCFFGAAPDYGGGAGGEEQGEGDGVEGADEWGVCAVLRGVVVCACC